MFHAPGRRGKRSEKRNEKAGICVVAAIRVIHVAMHRDASEKAASQTKSAKNQRARADAVAARICRSAGGRSKRGSMPSIGATFAITLPVVGAAFQPDVA